MFSPTHILLTLNYVFYILENTNLLIKLKDLFENLDTIENIRKNPILDLWIPKQINPQEFWFLNDGNNLIFLIDFIVLDFVLIYNTNIMATLNLPSD